MDKIKLLCGNCGASFKASREKFMASRKGVACPNCGGALRPKAEQSLSTANPFVSDPLPEVVESPKRPSAKRPIISTGALVALAVVATAALSCVAVLWIVGPGVDNPTQELAAALPIQPAPGAGHLAGAENDFDADSEDTLSLEDAPAVIPPMAPDMARTIDPPEPEPLPKVRRAPRGFDRPLIPPPEAGEVEVLSAAEPAVHYRWKPGHMVTYRHVVTADVGGSREAFSGLCRVLVGPTWEQLVMGKIEDAVGESPEEVELDEGSGSALVVSEDGCLITCAHVVEDAEQVAVELDGKLYEARVLVVDEQHDLALLRVAAQGLTPLSLSGSQTARLGEDIRVVGYPLASRSSSRLSVTRGTVSSLLAEEDGGLIQVDAPLNPGNSGGPVVNARGQVVGVAIAKVVHEDVSNVGFATPVKEVLALLARRSIKPNSTPLPEGLSAPDLIEKIGSGVALVRVLSRPAGPPPVRVNYGCVQTGFATPGQGVWWCPAQRQSVGELRTGPAGGVALFEDDLRPPFLWSHPLEWILEPLDPDGDQEWAEHFEHDLVIAAEDGIRPSGSYRRVLQPQSGRRGLGGGFPRPRFAGSDAFSQDAQETRYKAVTTNQYRIQKQEDGLVIILKKTNTNATDYEGRPVFDLHGTGGFSIRLDDGLPFDGQMRLTCDWKAQGAEQSFPVGFKFDRFTYSPSLLEEAVEKSAAAVLGEEAKEAEKLRRSGMDHGERLSAYLDDLRRALRTDQRVRQALSQLEKVPVIESRRKEVAAVLNQGVRESGDPSDFYVLLGKWGGPEEVTMLISNLEGADTFDIIDIIEGLTLSGDKRAIDPLVKLIATGGLTARVRASRALQRFGPAAEDSVLALLDNPDEDVREDACQLLGDIGTEKSLPALRKAKENGGTFEQVHARHSLLEIERRSRDGAEVHSNHLPRGIVRMREDAFMEEVQQGKATRENLRLLAEPGLASTTAAAALNKLAEGIVIEEVRDLAIQRIEPFLTPDAPQSVILPAIQAMAHWGTERQAPLLNKLLIQSPNREVLVVLFLAMAEIGDEESAQLLEKHLDDPDTCYIAMIGFRHLSSRLEQQLIADLAGDDIPRRALAATVLGRAGGPSARRALEGFVASGEQTLALDVAIDALGRLRARGIE